MTSPPSIKRELPQVKQVALKFEREFQEGIKRSGIDSKDVLAPVLEALAKMPSALVEILIASAADAAAEAGAATSVQEAEREKKLLEVLGRVSAAGKHNSGIIEAHIKALSTEVDALKERRKTKEALRRRLLMVGGAALVGGLMVGGLSTHYVYGKRSAELHRQLDAIRGSEVDRTILETFLLGSRRNRHNLSLLARENENVVENLTIIGLRTNEAERRDDSAWPGCIANGPTLPSQAGPNVATCLVEMGANIPTPGPPIFLQRIFGARSR